MGLEGVMDGFCVRSGLPGFAFRVGLHCFRSYMATFYVASILANLQFHPSPKCRRESLIQISTIAMETKPELQPYYQNSGSDLVEVCLNWSTTQVKRCQYWHLPTVKDEARTVRCCVSASALL